MPLVRDSTISQIGRHATKQLEPSSRIPHEFRRVWFTATGPTARGKGEQFISTIYGGTNISEMGLTDSRRCYFFLHGDFHKRATVLDGAVAAYTDGGSITVQLRLNPLSPNFDWLQESTVLRPFGTAIEDPIIYKSKLLLNIEVLMPYKLGIVGANF
jgi:hypothetical protein